MLENITRKHTNYRKNVQDKRFEIIELTYDSNKPNLEDANTAALILIGELAEFEPPVIGIDLSDIDFIPNIVRGEQTVQFRRTDATTIACPGYRRQGYVLDEEIAMHYNDIDSRFKDDQTES